MSTNQNKTNNHSYFMRLALMQAKKNLGNTKDNPSVGCVVVNNNNVISSGCTSINGRPHAEFNALNFIKKKLSNSNLYVTLEPCSNHGKTPPCVNLIKNKKIRNVYFSVFDPDKKSFNKSQNTLKKAGIKVKVGLYSNEIRSFYRSYFKYKGTSLPFVTCKIAVSKDYFMSDKNKKWLTNEYSRQRVHMMRSNHDCLLTSSGTIISDNPRLNCRIAGLEKRSPARAILDNFLSIPIRSKVFRDAYRIRTIVFYNKLNKKKIKLMKNLNVEAYKIDVDPDGNLHLKKILYKLKNLGFSRIFLESGFKLTSNFLKLNLVNDLNLFISSKNLGVNGHGNIKNYFRTFLSNKIKINEKVNLFGDKLITYKLN